MKKSKLGSMALATIACASLVLANPKPNVVIIYGDDVGYGDVGVYGSKMIPTPNIDKLAGQGLVFTDGHCAAATCTPSRFSMLTGRYAFRHEGTGILPGDAAMAIKPEMFTLPDLFQQAGYKTAVFGKWHLGLGDGETPIDWNKEIKPGPLEIGFDCSFLFPATNDRVPCVYMRNRHILNIDPADPITVSYKNKLTDTYPDGKEHPEAMTYYPSTHGHNNSVINGIGRIGWMSGGKTALWNDEDNSDVLVQEARAFIDANKTKPFFIYFASQDIHVPRTPHKRFHGATELGYRGDAMVAFDWSTGEIMKALAENGLTENTIVIFSSDNGPVYDDGYADGCTVKTSTKESDRGHDSSGELRGGKYQIYEGGTRVPFIVSWPGTIKAGSSPALVTQTDFMASFAEFLKIDLPAGEATDSQNVLAALLGKSVTGNELIIEQARGVKALRQGPWKYIPAQKGNKKKNLPPVPPQLFNLDEDLGETANLIGQHPERANELKALLKKYQEKGLREQ
ncbi:sulfatase family protein [Pontiella sulfatireligans]|uniref:Arylsulfatase n=1 Tax=Pontiella sulfatireligans TaxID=2750658 RepID=A0A6C2URK4_9BACT|nr:arylsulfatase [Pontiella sulfatireligans]SPS74540.1 sulfatase S1_15 [Kiritimatiellales bacterium]VGO22952.1 Arylsulfatase [Pontiella sulfatireligans]